MQQPSRHTRTCYNMRLLLPRANKQVYTRGVLGLLVSLILILTSVAFAKPKRIVSLNLCTDSMLLELADREHIASITYLSLSPEVSYLVDKARGLHVNHGLAEEVIPLVPDLVLAGRVTTRPTTALLQRLGYKVLVFDPVDSLPTLRANLRRVAEAIGEMARAERLIASMDARIRRVRADAASYRPLAVVFRADGFTVGRRSLINDILVAAGLRNLSAELGTESVGYLPLESLVMAGPQLIIFGSFKPRYPSLAHELLGHRALRAMLHLRQSTSQRTSMVVPTRLWACEGTFVAEAVERLAAERARLAREHVSQ
ncbi:MAG: ABC transporter substrate-binding protein [Acidiferrobacterales bacterium]